MLALIAECFFSINTHQINPAFGRRVFPRNLLGALLVVVEHAYAHPPITAWSFEVEDLGGAIAALEFVFHLGCGIFITEAANLHLPASAGVEIGGRLQHFNLYLGDSRVVDADALGRLHRKINDPVGHERPPVGNAHHDRLPGRQVSHTHHGVEWKRKVGGGELVHVVNFAVRCFVFVVVGAVPARQTGLRVKRLRVGRRRRLNWTWLARAGFFWVRAGRNGGGGDGRRRRNGHLCGSFFAAPSQQKRHRGQGKDSVPVTWIHEWLQEWAHVL